MNIEACESKVIPNIVVVLELRRHVHWIVTWCTKKLLDAVKCLAHHNNIYYYCSHCIAIASL